MLKKTCFLLQLILFVAVIFPSAVFSAPELKEVRVGINGYYKSGFWTPVFLRWSGENAGQIDRIDLITVDSDGTSVRYRNSAPKIAERDGFFSTMLSLKSGRSAAEMLIELRSGDSVLESRKIRPEPLNLRGGTISPQPGDFAAKETCFFSSLPQERPLILVLGTNDGGLQDAISMQRLRDAVRPVVVVIDSLEQLPADVRGLDAVELFFLTTSQTGIWEGKTSEDPRITAIAEWMNRGGTVFFTPGKASEPFISKPDSPLSGFLPGKFERMTTLRQGKPIELYCGSNRSIIMEGNEIAPYLNMPFLQEPRGIVDLYEGDLPVVIREPRGFGALIYFGADLTDAPLSDWRDRGLLVLRLLKWSESKTATNSPGHSIIHLGFTDLSGQVRSALDRFEGVSTTPFSVILVLIVVYILLIGPVDWFFVHRVLKKPQLTWFTFPAWIVIFCCFAFFLNHSNRIQPLTINSVDLLDLNPARQQARITTWANVFSPRDERYDLTLETLSTDPGRCEIHWLGLSGSALGAMDPKTISFSLWSDPYDFSDQHGERLQDVPIRVRSSKSFFGQWNSDSLFREDSSSSAKSPGFSVSSTVPGTDPVPSVKLKELFRDQKLKETEGIPSGTFTNEFPVAMENALLIYGHWVLKIGRLESGQSMVLGTSTVRREIRMILNSTEIGFDENQGSLPMQQSLSYSAQSHETWPILRTMSLFKIFGGHDSIGLHNTLTTNLDLSASLQVGRSLLICELDMQDPKSHSLGNRIVIQPRNSGENSVDSREVEDHNSSGGHSVVARILIPVEK